VFGDADCHTKDDEERASWGTFMENGEETEL